MPSNYTQYSVDPSPSLPGKSFIVSGFPPVKSSFKGKGVLFSGVEGGGDYAMLFSMRDGVEVKPTGSGPYEVVFDDSDRFPCSGFMSSDDEGYLIAPAFRLKSWEGKELVLMLVSPALTPHQVYSDKMNLTVPGVGGSVAVSTESGVVQCRGVFPAGFKSARVVLNRDPGHPLFRNGFDQLLCEMNGPGEINAVWKPVARTFEERLLVFDPLNLKSVILHDFLDSVQPEGDSGVRDEIVVGDGVGIGYLLRLVLDRGLGRHSSDETKLEVAY